MADKLRFHLDENVSGVIAPALRRYDIDVTSVSLNGYSLTIPCRTALITICVRSLACSFCMIVLT